MRYSTIILTGMAAYAYAQDAELDSLSSQLASLTALDPSQAESSLKEIFATLDPGVRSSVSSALSAVGVDYASITAGLGTAATATASSSSNGAEQTTGSQTGGAQNTGSPINVASTTDSEGMAAATAFPIAAIGAGIAMIGLL